MSGASGPRPVEDVYSSILVDIAASARVAPRIVPEDFGPDGRYRLDELVGIGRDSHVYRAVDRHLSRPDVPAVVAIKIRASGAEARTEALVGRSVVHDHVVRVIDHGRDGDGAAYVVQEYIDGGDLTELSLPLDPRESARLMVAIARGLQALHSAGNIHGDLKPSNILRTGSGVPKITDFDLAVAGDLDPGPRGGNLAFMAPERVLDAQTLPSPLADIYALGGLLHFFLTGRPALGETGEQILGAHRAGRVPDLEGVDRDLRAICLRALAPDAADRYRSAEAFADDLSSWLGHRPLGWTRCSPSRRTALLVRRHPVGFVVGALALLSLGATAALAFSLATREIEAERRAVAMTRADIDRLNARSRSAIERFIRSGAASGGAESGPSIFVGLVWVDWLADTPILGDAGPTLARDERIRSLTRLREHYAGAGQTGSLGDSIAAYSLAYSYLEMADTERARGELDAVASGALGLLGPDDDMRRAVDGLEAVWAYQEARGSDGADAAGMVAELRRIQTDLRRLDGKHSVGRLIDRTLSPAERPGR
ncbi:MAG: serine/threonine protein kinase [Phycisphaerales bacterium]|nr:serine/threonine protein kinase [Phycisphaerales bacterium]